MLYRDVPDVETVRAIKKPETRKTMREGGIDLAGDKLLIDRAEDIATKLAVDYTSLFIAGNGKLSLSESVYKSDGDELWGNRALLIRKQLEAIGLNVADKWTKPIDHLAVGFEFMAILTDAEDSAQINKDHDGKLRSKELQQQFFQDHLNEWVVRLCEDVISNAQTSFYRELARITQSFIILEGQRFES
jgi:TorA maturation chaperone TorD